MVVILLRDQNKTELLVTKEHPEWVPSSIDHVIRVSDLRRQKQTLEKLDSIERLLKFFHTKEMFASKKLEEKFTR